MALTRQLVAVDANVLLDLAEEEETSWDAIDTLRRRLVKCSFLVPPTVLHELANLLDHGPTPEMQQAAWTAAQRLRREWKFEPVDLMPVEHGIVERIAERVRHAGLLPAEEFNDSLILAESALLECMLLLTSDAHLREVDFRRASLELAACDADLPLIASPREIVAKFF